MQNYHWLRTILLCILAIAAVGCLAEDEFYDDEFYDDGFYEDDEFFFDEEPLNEDDEFFFDEEEPIDEAIFDEGTIDSGDTDAPAAAASLSNDVRIIEWSTSGQNFVEAEFTIEPGDASFLVYARTSDINEYVYFTELQAPSGTMLYEADLDSNEVTAAPFGNEWVENVGEAALYYPTAPQFPLETGTYRVVVQTDDPAITAAGVIIRSGVSDSGRYALDLNIWPVTTAGDFDNAQWRDQFTATIRPPMDDLLRPHQLQIGRIDYFSASNSDINEFADLRLAEEPDEDDGNRMGQLCLAADDALGSERALNIIIVDQITNLSGIDTGTAGISSGLPGTVLVPDSTQSCVVVSWYAFEDSYVEQAGNIIHEASHLMSLSHTTEMEGAFFDIFTDTPECPANQFDEDDSGDIDEFECGLEGGAKNYMFYSGDLSFAPYTMSADQAWALRRHPLFYEQP